MAENVTLARPYAEAAFKLARDGKTLPVWKDGLDRMAIIAADPDMQRLIANPKLLPAQLAQLFLDVAGKVSDERKNFVNVLIETDRRALLPEVRELFVAV